VRQRHPVSWKNLAAGHLAVTSECHPPKGSDPGVIIKKARFIKDHADAIDVTDNQTAVTRLCSLASGIHLNALGLDPAFQLVLTAGIRWDSLSLKSLHLAVS